MTLASQEAYKKLDDFTRRAIASVGVEVEATLNDSDKTFTVPAGEVWEIVSIYVELISTATGGNRQMVVELQDDSANVLVRFYAGAVQADTITREYHFAPGLPNDTSFGGPSSDQLATRLPDSLEADTAWVIRVADDAAIDATADDMTVHMVVRKRIPAEHTLPVIVR